MNRENLCPEHGLPINAAFTCTIERRRIDVDGEFTGESSNVEGPTILGYGCTQCPAPIRKNLSNGCQITLVQKQPAEG